jgi:hypothetical protein
VRYSSKIVICCLNAVNGERGHPARFVRHFCRTVFNRWGCFAIFVTSREDHRQHAGGSEQNARAPRSDLHNTLTQKLVLLGEQSLHERVTAFISVARSSSEMMVDSHSRGATETTVARA